MEAPDSMTGWYRIVFDNAPVGMLLCRLNGTILEANSFICSLVGFSKDQLIGTNITALLDKAELKRMPLRERELKETGEVITRRHFKHASGESRYLEIDTKLLSGGIALVTVSDITVKLKLERENRFHSMLLHQISDRITATDLEGNILYVNQAEERMLKRPAGEFIGKTVRLYGDDPARGATQEEIIRRTREEGEWSGEVVNFDTGGGEHIVRCRTSLIYDEEGKPVMMVGIGTDITSEKAREDDAHMMAEMLDAAPGGITVHGFDGRFYYSNRKNLEMHGYTMEEFLNLTLDKLDVPESASMIEARIEKIRTQGSASFTVQHYTRDGGVIPLEIFVKQVVWKGKPALLSIATDITERLRVEEQLRNSEERFRLAFVTSPDSININEMGSGKYVEVNDGFLKMTGYTREEVIGKTSLDLGIWANLDDRKRLTGILSREGQVINLEAPFRFRNGEIHTGLMSASVIQLNGKPHIISITRDIELIKQTQLELEKARDQAEEASRLKTAFLNNISHEVRTPMNAILGFSDLLQAEDLEPEEKSRFHHIVQSNARQLLSIIDDVLELSRMDSGRLPVNRTVFSLQEMMEDIFHTMMEKVSGKGLEFIQATGKIKGPDIIRADKEKIRQVLTGFINNAVKYTGSGRISLGVDFPGDQIEFFVSDTGCGIPSAEHQKIFERFYQVTHPGITRGTGLGLSIARGLVEIMGGTIGVDSAPGEGSRFWFRIGIEPVSHWTAPEVSRGSVNLKELTILIAEDEDYNFEFLEIYLARRVKRVLRAINGSEAVKIFKEHRPDIVLMDLKMPGMDGYQATRSILNARRDAVVIALTAYTQPEEEKRAMDAGCVAFVSKPVSAPELLNVVMKYLRN